MWSATSCTARRPALLLLALRTMTAARECPQPLPRTMFPCPDLPKHQDRSRPDPGLRTSRMLLSLAVLLGPLLFIFFACFTHASSTKQSLQLYRLTARRLPVHRVEASFGRWPNGEFRTGAAVLGLTDAAHQRPSAMTHSVLRPALQNGPGDRSPKHRLHISELLLGALGCCAFCWAMSSSLPRRRPDRFSFCCCSGTSPGDAQGIEGVDWNGLRERGDWGEGEDWDEQEGEDWGEGEDWDEQQEGEDWGEGEDWDELQEGEQVVNLDFVSAKDLIAQLNGDGLFDPAFDDNDDNDDNEFLSGDLTERAWRDDGLLSDARPLLPCDAARGAAAPAGLVDAMRRDGVVRINGALSAATAAELRSFVLAELELQRKVAGDGHDGNNVGAGDDGPVFSAVLSPSDVAPDAPTTRWDLRLPLTGVVRQAAEELLGQRDPGGGGDGERAASVGAVLDALTGGGGGGGDAEVWELAALVSRPGSAPQIVHSDTVMSAEPCLFTAFVALQDITPAHGPTRFLPGTHTRAAHAAFGEGRNAEAFLPGADVVEATLGAGDCSLYDSRLLHCGGRNTLPPRAGDNGADVDARVLFYVTVRHPSADAEELGNPAAHSIRPEYAGQLQLGHFRCHGGSGALRDWPF